MTSDSPGGVVNRIEDSRVGFVVRYWNAAAYDRPEDRGPEEWAKAAIVPLVLVLPLGLLHAAALYAVETYPAYFPEPGTPAGFVLDIFPAAHDAATGILFGLAMMYLGKLLILVAEESYQEAAA